MNSLRSIPMAAPALACVMLAVGSGCSTSPGGRMQFTSGAGYYQHHGAEGEALRGATRRVWGADASRLADEIERAAGDLGWAVLRIASPDEGTPEADAVTSAWLLLPNNQTVTVLAGPVGAMGSDEGGGKEDVAAAATERRRQIAASVRVGLQGDPQLQAAYLDALQTRLAGKVKRKVGGYFELPEIRFPKLEALGLSRRDPDQSSESE